MEPEGLEMLAALGASAHRFAAVARQVREPTKVMPNSTWTAADLVAHVALGVDGYARYIEGNAKPFADVSDLGGGSLTTSNAARLAEFPERDIGLLLKKTATRLAELRAKCLTRSIHDLVPWHGRQEPLRCVLAVLLTEYVVHGRDLAKAVGARWRIDNREALLVLRNTVPLLPILVNPETTKSVATSIEVRLRGGRHIPLVFYHGTLTIDEGKTKFSATVNADPVSFLLVAYGRVGKWHEIRRGKFVAWGRKPWVALKLPSYLVHP